MYVVTVYVEGGVLDAETLACGPHVEREDADEALTEIMEGLDRVGLGGQVDVIELDRYPDELLRRVLVTGESPSTG